MTADKAPRRWWIEDNDANRTIPAERAKHRYLEVLECSSYDALKAERDELKFELEAKQRPLSEQVLSLTLEMDELMAELQREKKKAEQLKRLVDFARACIEVANPGHEVTLRDVRYINTRLAELEALDKESEGAK